MRRVIVLLCLLVGSSAWSGHVAPRRIARRSVAMMAEDPTAGLGWINAVGNA